MVQNRWNLTADLLLPNGIGLRNCIYSHINVGGELTTLENGRIMCLKWYLCGSYNTDRLKHRNYNHTGTFKERNGNTTSLSDIGGTKSA